MGGVGWAGSHSCRSHHIQQSSYSINPSTSIIPIQFNRIPNPLLRILRTKTVNLNLMRLLAIKLLVLQARATPPPRFSISLNSSNNVIIIHNIKILTILLLANHGLDLLKVLKMHSHLNNNISAQSRLVTSAAAVANLLSTICHHRQSTSQL